MNDKGGTRTVYDVIATLEGSRTEALLTGATDLDEAVSVYRFLSRRLGFRSSDDLSDLVTFFGA